MARAGATEAASKPMLITANRPGIGTSVWG